MASSDLTILDLNDYCLGHILKYLDVEGHVQFGQVCKRFQEVLKDWSYVLYPEFEIKQTNDSDDADELKWQLKLFCIVCDVVRSLYLNIQHVNKESHLSKCMTDLCTKMKTMENLQYFAIHEGSVFGLRLLEAPSQNIDQILSAMEFLPKIKSISLRCRTNDYKAVSLIQMTCLQQVSIDTKLASEDLIEICKSNKNLRVLWLREVTGELSDIVPHCKNLEEIAFPILANHKSYAELAELPKLKKIIIKGSTTASPCKKTMELFTALASKQPQVPLESLIIFSNLDVDETNKLIELTFLKELRCGFDDARCIDLLTDLIELEGLYIMLGRSAAGSKECLNVLKSCNKLQRLHVNSNLSTDFVEKAVDVLRRVRNIEKQKPLQLYSSGVMHLCNEEGEKLVDNAYCTLVNQSEHLRALPWRF